MNRTNQHYLPSVPDRADVKINTLGAGGVVKMEALEAQAHLMHPLLYTFLLGLPESGDFERPLVCSTWLLFHEDTLKFTCCPLSSFNFPRDSYCFLELNVQLREQYAIFSFYP